MNTEFIKKGGESAARHGGKIVHGLNAAAIIWLYATFVAKDDFRDHCRRCDDYADECDVKRSKQWQKLADLELKTERLEIRQGLQPLRSP